MGTVASLLLHMLALILLIWPFASGIVPVEIAQGAGGPGPAGGGGGGSRGTGAPETIKYVRIAPAEPPPGSVGAFPFPRDAACGVADTRALTLCVFYDRYRVF